MRSLWLFSDFSARYTGSRRWFRRPKEPQNAWITSTLMESTSETAEIAAEPTLLTIMLSAVPIREVRNCSATSGIRSIFSA